MTKARRERALKVTLGAFAITALCSACAPDSTVNTSENGGPGTTAPPAAPVVNTSEIPHPPFTAERFSRFEDEALFHCINEFAYKSKGAQELAVSLKGDIFETIEAETREIGKLFRDENKCYVAAQIKWGVTHPLFSDQFNRMRDDLRDRCDKPAEKRSQAWNQVWEPRLLKGGDPGTDPQVAEALKEFGKELDDRVASQDRCYREIQTKWDFK